MKLVMALGTVSGALAAGLFGLSFYNRRNHSKVLAQIPLHKDSTRPDYLYFGVNLGSRTDTLIMNNIDSGDFLFFTESCHKMLGAMDMGRCLLRKGLRSGVQMGVAFRDKSGLVIIHNDPSDKTTYVQYDQFLSRPYIQSVILRKLTGLTLSQVKTIQHVLQQQIASAPHSSLSSLLASLQVLEEEGTRSGELLLTNQQELLKEGVGLDVPIVIRGSKNSK